MAGSSELIGRLLTGPDDTELTARDLALLAAHLHNNRPHPSWWQQRNRGIECPELECYQKLKTILDFNRNLQGALASSAPDRANSNAGTMLPAAKEQGKGSGSGSGSPLAGRGEDVSPATRLAGVGHSKNAEAEQVSKPKMFSGGEMVFYPDRVELCDRIICGGPRCEQARKTLDLFRQKNAKGKFVAIGSKKLAEKIERKGGASSVPGLIRDLRTRIVEALRQGHIECQREDVIQQTNRGYHFRDWISAQDGEGVESSAPMLEGRHEKAASPGDVPVNGTVDVPVNVPVDSHDVDPVSESADAAVARRKWILEQVTNGRKMRAPGFAAELGCSDRTVKRDLDALEPTIEFVGSPRTGYYQLRQVRKPR